MAAWLIALTITLPWLGALLVWGATDRAERMQHALAAIFSLASALAALALLPFTSPTAAISIPFGGVSGVLTFVPDGFGVFLAIVATVVGSMAVLFSADYMRGERQLGRYYMLMLFFIGAMAGLALTGSLLFLFIFWELTALCSYALISFYNDAPRAVSAGIKALVITQLGGSGLLAGTLLIYARLGTYEIGEFLARAHTLPASTLALLAFAFLAAAAAKSAQVPFHTWLPDAMEAPTPASALIHAATMVNAGVYLLARFYPAFAPVPGWTTTVIIVGTLSALLAALMAVVASDLKRVLAYSTISQLGYMLYGVGVGAIFASQFHLLSHALFKALLFLGAGSIIHALGTRDMRQMGGLWGKVPFARTCFLTGALALAGLPLFNGFWSKELLLEQGAANGPLWAYLIMLLVAGLTALYTARMVWFLFFGKPATAREVHDAPAAMRAALAPLALGTSLSWLLAGPFARLLEQSLPFYRLHAMPTRELLSEILMAPATLVALAVVILGLASWRWREALRGFHARLSVVERMATASFGFEWLNHRLVALTDRASATLRRTQTGQLNWNMVGIVGTLAAMLALLALVG